MLTKYTLLNKTYEKLTLVTFLLSFVCIFLILSILQYVNFVNEIIFKSSRNTHDKSNAITVGPEERKKYEDIWSIWAISAIAVNSLIGAATIFFAVKKFTPYFTIFYKKLINMDDEP